MGDGNVVYGRLLHSAVIEFSREYLRSVGSVAVYRCEGDKNTVDLGCICRPCSVFIHEIPDVIIDDRTVERTDEGDVESRGFLEDGHDLRTVLSDYVRVVSSRLGEPLEVEVHIGGEDTSAYGSECPECVRGEQDAVRGEVAHHDLRPVDHLRCGECKRL